MKALTIVGARPQFIKAAPLSIALRDAGITEVLVHTGQHYDYEMSNVFFDELGMVKPHFNLGVGSGSHAEQTAKMLTGLEPIVVQEKPDWVVIFGDTNSTLAGALVAAKLHVPLAHIEAGLRSFNKMMPEEINRIVADDLSDLLFAPTETAVKNLRAEGKSEEKIKLVGDVMYDAALLYGKIAAERSTILLKLGLQSKGFVLVTVHRAENTDDPERLRVIVEALASVAAERTVVFPIHPRTRKVLSESPQLQRFLGSLKMIDPVGYLDMIQLERHASVVATDSGGIQKEAYFFRTPCVTLRMETEWVELVALRWNRLVSLTSVEAIARSILSVTVPSTEGCHPFGIGKSAQQIASVVRDCVSQ